MKKILVINGPNMNLLGERQPEIYGELTLVKLNEKLAAHAVEKALQLDFFQSNHEGVLIDRIHAAKAEYDGIIINPAALTHYSYAIADALSAVALPAVEVHLSDIFKREDFRKTSVTAPSCLAQFCGRGAESYLEALDFLAGIFDKKFAI